MEDQRTGGHVPGGEGVSLSPEAEAEVGGEGEARV